MALAHKSNLWLRTHHLIIKEQNPPSIQAWYRALAFPSSTATNEGEHGHKWVDKQEHKATRNIYPCSANKAITKARQ